MKIIFCFLMGLALISFPSQVEATPFNDVEWGILQLEMFGMRTQVVENDMRLQVGREDFRDGRKSGGKQSVSDLKKLRNRLKNLNVPTDIDPLKEQLDGVMGKLQSVYLDIHKKNDEQIRNEFEAFWSDVDAYNNQLSVTGNAHLEVPKLGDNFDILIYEAKLFKNPKDRMFFLKASKLMDIGKTFEAWKILEGLLKKYQGTDLEGSVLTRSVQCLQSDRGGVLSHFRGWDRDLARLKKFLDRREYSTSLYDIYPQWVTLEQSFNHGMSNMSEIPNNMYLDMRWKLVEIIRDHLLKNPDDGWAKIQAFLLMDQPIIQRDCGEMCRMGNTNLLWMARYILKR